MKILIAHNTYLSPGGEDVVARQEAELLREHGHSVVVYQRSNAEIETRSMGRSALLRQAIWASDSRDDLQKLLCREKPDLVHFHNTFAMISPSVYYTCKHHGVPVLQTVHNYRLLCLRADLFRDGKVCEECIGTSVPWPGLRHRCYHGSLSKSAAVAAMLVAHRGLGTWKRKVDLFIAPSAFVAGKLIEGGIPEQKIVVKPNFTTAPTTVRAERDDHYAIYIGRLSPEKGALKLVNAWDKEENLRLLVVGAGPDQDQIRATIRDRALENVEMMGQLAIDRTAALLKGALFLVCPSECHETFGLVLIEAFACGVPVIAARAGAIGEIVDDGHSGLLFTAGNAYEFRQKVRWAIDHREAMHQMGRNARRVYEEKYTAERNYPILMDIYQRATGCLAHTSSVNTEIADNQPTVSVTGGK